MGENLPKIISTTTNAPVVKSNRNHKDLLEDEASWRFCTVFDRRCFECYKELPTNTDPSVKIFQCGRRCGAKFCTKDCNAKFLTLRGLAHATSCQVVTSALRTKSDVLSRHMKKSSAEEEKTLNMAGKEKLTAKIAELFAYSDTMLQSARAQDTLLVHLTECDISLLIRLDECLASTLYNAGQMLRQLLLMDDALQCLQLSLAMGRLGGMLIVIFDCSFVIGQIYHNLRRYTEALHQCTKRHSRLLTRRIKIITFLNT